MYLIVRTISMCYVRYRKYNDDKISANILSLDMWYILLNKEKRDYSSISFTQHKNNKRFGHFHRESGIRIFDPRGRHTLTAVSDHYFNKWCLFQSRKQNKFQVRLVIANAGTVSLAEGFIYDTRVLYTSFPYRLKNNDYLIITSYCLDNTNTLHIT